MKTRTQQELRDLKSNVVAIVHDALNLLEDGKTPTRDAAIFAASGGESGLKRQAIGALELLQELVAELK